MKAFIPEIGTELKLSDDWTFELYQESRNSDIFLADGKKSCGWREDLKSYSRTLPAGSVFLVDRIYVRKGAKEFSSVTLRLTETTDAVLTRNGTQGPRLGSKKKKNYGRFWVKLADFNSAEFEVVNDTSISAAPTEVHNEPATLEIIKRRSSWGLKYWVKFEHEDPELCYEGELTASKLGRTYSIDTINTPDYPHTMEREQPSWTRGKVVYHFYPKYFFESLVADSWKKARESDSRYHTTVPNKLYGKFGWGHQKTVTVVKHPLEDEIHISTEKKDRLPLGIKTDKTDLVDIPIAGGKLSIYDIKLR